MYQKFIGYIQEKKLLFAGDGVVIALSGGPDSLCLLYLMHRLSKKLNLKLIVAHLNHCLRPEAEEEVQGLKALAESLSLPFVTRTVDIKRLKGEKGISEEEAGRLARYSLLFDAAREYNVSKIALGHHLDDQAETVLFNIIRGTGPDGLAGILPLSRRGSFMLIRPLLCFRRSEIEKFCSDNNLSPYADSTNLALYYTRNRLRLELIPQIEREYNPRIREALFSLAKLAEADRKLLQGLARHYYKKLVRLDKNKITLERGELLKIPSALRGRVLRLALLHFLPAGKINRKHISRLAVFARTGQTGKVLILPGRVEARCLDNSLVVSLRGINARPKTEQENELPVPGRVVLPDGKIITAEIKNKDDVGWPPEPFRGFLDYASLDKMSLKVAYRLPGDRFFPQGASGSKKLKDFLIDQKVPLHQRDCLPLVKADDIIIWVAGHRIAHPFRVTDDTEKVLELTFIADGTD